MKFLVEECHANVEVKQNHLGNTPLITASSRGHLATVKYLVEKCGADVEAKANSGETALALAKLARKSDVVQYLQSKRTTD